MHEWTKNLLEQCSRAETLKQCLTVQGWSSNLAKWSFNLLFDLLMLSLSASLKCSTHTHAHTHAWTLSLSYTHCLLGYYSTQIQFDLITSKFFLIEKFTSQQSLDLLTSICFGNFYQSVTHCQLQAWFFQSEEFDNCLHKTIFYLILPSRWPRPLARFFGTNFSID